MQPNSWLMLRILLNRYHLKGSDALLRYLPAEDQDALKAQGIQTDQAAAALEQPLYLIQRMHYTWLLPIFQKIPQELYASFLSLFSDATLSKLRTLLRLPSNSTPITLSPPVKQFLIDHFYQLMDIQHLLPLAFLPESPLTPLAKCCSKELNSCIDFLGLYDLTEEVKHVIDTKRLKQLRASLTDSQWSFLQHCLRQSDKMAAPSLKLKEWSGDKEELKKMLHKRGLLRLSKALCGQHPDLVWYIVHAFDLGRGSSLNKLISPTPVAGVTPFLVQQVLTVMNFLKIPNPL